MKRTTIKLPEDFEKGQCQECPFSYFCDLGGGLGYEWVCSMNYLWNECPLEIEEADDGEEISLRRVQGA